MKPDKKLKPFDAAVKIVNERFPECDAALLAGSVVRGEATINSDLDIIIFDHRLTSSYRESFIEFDWPIEVFAHNFQSYKKFFESDVKRGRPSLPRMVSEAIVICNHEMLTVIKNEAVAILVEGPEEWSTNQIDVKRYFITDVLDDLIGSNNRAEEVFIASTLADHLHEFVLRSNKRWIGSSKWIMKELSNFDPKFAEQFFQAFDSFYRTGEKKWIVALADSILEPFGGRLFNGFKIK